MGESVATKPPPADADRLRRQVRGLLLVSLGFLVAQTYVTDYGGDGAATGVLWLVFAGVMLWLVYRRQSRLSRAVIVASSLVGALLYAPAAVTDYRSAFLVVTFLGQAAPLLLGPVNRYLARS